MKIKTKPINVRINQQLLRDFMRTEVYRLNRDNLTAAVEDVMRTAVKDDQDRARKAKEKASQDVTPA